MACSKEMKSNAKCVPTTYIENDVSINLVGSDQIDGRQNGLIYANSV